MSQSFIVHTVEVIGVQSCFVLVLYSLYRQKQIMKYSYLALDQHDVKETNNLKLILGCLNCLK